MTGPGFDSLDGDRDGVLSPEDLRLGATRLGWHWPEAPLYAVLHRLSVSSPLSREDFHGVLEQIRRDPGGVYGEVLRRAPLPSSTPPQKARPAAEGSVLDHLRGEAREDYQRLLDAPGARLRRGKSALLIIDPQHAFTGGTWMRSFGRKEVGPIRAAFGAGAQGLPEDLETVFTRCPFPPESYEWEQSFQAVLSPAQAYFVKPGNSVLWPPTNGFREWAESLLERGRDTLVVGGCTLTSCVRVSAVDVITHLRGRLKVLVDLRTCGARVSNYNRSAEFGGVSPVEAAVTEMRAVGVEVVPKVDWV